MEPDNISFPVVTSRGTDSPVNAEVSIKLVPSKTVPSNGTLSPGLIIINSPIDTSSGDTLISLSSLKTFAWSALIFIREDIDFLDLFTAYPWNTSPI